MLPPALSCLSAPGTGRGARRLGPLGCGRKAGLSHSLRCQRPQEAVQSGPDATRQESEHQPGVAGGIPQPPLARASLLLTGMAGGSPGLHMTRNEALSPSSGSTSPGSWGEWPTSPPLVSSSVRGEITVTNGMFPRGAWRAPRQNVCEERGPVPCTELGSIRRLFLSLRSHFTSLSCYFPPL